jgi:hypothetical protein
MTNYIVLMKLGQPDGWNIIGSTEAHGPTQAVRKVSDAEGEYLAIPERNATFVSQANEVPEPRVTAVVVHASTYLDNQPTLLDEEPVEAEPVPA